MAEPNVTTVNKFWDAFNAHNLDGWNEVCAPNYINHDPGLPTPEADLPTIKQTIGGLQAAFPDIRSDEEDIISQGDNVVVRRTFRGTHKGEFMGAAPTDNGVTFTGIFIHRLAGGKIEETWFNFDALGLLRQIGAIPTW